MLSKLFEHCILYKYNDIIHVESYNSISEIIIQFNKLHNSDIPNNHIKYINNFKYWPYQIKKLIYNYQFIVDYSNISQTSIEDFRNND